MDKFLKKMPRMRPTAGARCHDQSSSTGKTGDRRVTRDVIKKDEEKDRDAYVQMSLPEKRKLYKCGNKYVTLEDEDKIYTWPAYYNAFIESKKKKRLSEKAKRDYWLIIKEKEKHYDVKETINNKVSLWQGDITRLEIDAIGNAANSSLLGGGGVDGAIHSSAGVKLKRECSKLGGCETGDAKITGGYNLPARWVVHTVGPIGECPGDLKSCYTRCLEIMKEKRLKSLALPCISTGIYGYPNDKAAAVALKTVREWLENSEYAKEVERIIFCVFLKIDLELYEEGMQVFFPIASEKQDDKDEEKAEPQTEKENIDQDVKSSPSETRSKKGQESDMEVDVPDKKTAHEDKPREKEVKSKKPKERGEKEMDGGSPAPKKKASAHL